jgi:hypothetical protein
MYVNSVLSGGLMSYAYNSADSSARGGFIDKIPGGIKPADPGGIANKVGVVIAQGRQADRPDDSAEWLARAAG